MEVKFSKSAVKFLEKLDEKNKKQIRVIFTVNNNSNELLVYEIDFRGDAYKK
jgi:mRNA-degrading endonuclease RelE of RelBE toxin-antitoxin system